MLYCFHTELLDIWGEIQTDKDLWKNLVLVEEKFNRKGYSCVTKFEN